MSPATNDPTAIKPYEIRGLPLRSEFLRRGYRKEEVQDYIEAVLFVIQKDPEYLTDNELKQLLDPPLSVSHFMLGYKMEDVEYLVVEVNKMLKGYLDYSK